MGKLTDEELKRIVNRATLFQKIYRNSPKTPVSIPLQSDYPNLFEITDSLNLDRAYVYEAMLEYEGIPIEEPIAVDAGFSNAEILGFAKHGVLSPEVLNELKAEIEYHFNTRGKFSHRKNRTIWNATPSGPARLIASMSSPEIILEENSNSLLIRAKQSLKTTNKLYAPAIVATFGAFMLFAAGLIEGGHDTPPMIISSLIIFGLSMLYARFITSRKKKKKAQLSDLVERLQLIFERKSKSQLHQTISQRIEIPEDEYSENLSPNEPNQSQQQRE